MSLDDNWTHNQLYYELAIRIPSYNDVKHLFRYMINSMTCAQECSTFTLKSIQCLYPIDKNEIEKDVLFSLAQQMQRTQDDDFLVDDATIWGFGQDCKVESKYECMKTRFKSSRIVKTTEGGFLMEAIFECEGYRELAV